jgi:hypothetical protein
MKYCRRLTTKNDRSHASFLLKLVSPMVDLRCYTAVRPPACYCELYWRRQRCKKNGCRASMGCCHCDRDLIMLYFIPATISSCRGKGLQDTPSCHCRSSQYSIHTVPQSFLQKILKSSLGIGTSTSTEPALHLHINSVAGTPLTLTMINTGMWIQGRFLGKGRGRQINWSRCWCGIRCAAASARCFSHRRSSFPSFTGITRSVHLAYYRNSKSHESEEPQRRSTMELHCNSNNPSHW